MLCQDELTRRDAAALVKRVRAARFEEPGYPGAVRLYVQSQDPASTIRDLAALGFVFNRARNFGPGSIGDEATWRFLWQ